jgi:hypothetical protein
MKQVVSHATFGKRYEVRPAEQRGRVLAERFSAEAPFPKLRHGDCFHYFTVAAQSV